MKRLLIIAVLGVHASIAFAQMKMGAADKPPMAGCESMREQMPGMDAKLRALVDDMNRAEGAAKVDKMAAVITELVAQRAMMQQGCPMMNKEAAATEHAIPPGGHHAAMNARGAHAMGFDQEKTTHHFYIYKDGGAIDVAVNDPADTADRDAIRAHLPHIAMMFGAGNFDAPMLVHDTTVPGTAEMSRLKDHIAYTYAETPKGGRVDITTSDAGALAAVHAFLRFQISDHRTGDSLEVKARP